MFGQILFNKKLASLYKQVFTTPAGKEVLKDLITFCRLYQPTFSSQDPHQTAFNEGMRRVGLRIINFVEKDDLVRSEMMFNLMKSENNDDEQY